MEDFNKTSLSELNKDELEQLKRSAMHQSRREALTCYQNTILTGLIALATIPTLIIGSLAGVAALGYALPEPAFLPTILSGTALTGLSIAQVKKLAQPIINRGIHSHWESSSEFQRLARSL